MSSSQSISSAREALQVASKHMGAGRMPQAEGLIRQVLQAQPNNHEALNLLGVIALNTGHTDQAVSIFSQAVQFHGDEAEYHCNLGVALLSSNRPEDGEQALARALKIMPGHAMANFNLGLRDLQAGRFEEAFKHLDKAVKKMPKNVAALNALGVASSKCAKPAKAVQLFRSVLKAHPDHLEARLNLANTLTEMDKAEDALEHYQTVIARAPNKANAYFGYGVALRQAKRSGEAIEAYKKAIELDPQYVDAHVNLASRYAARGCFGMALEHVRTANRLRPDDFNLMYNELSILIDGAYVAEALALSDKLLQLSPDDKEVLRLKIRTLHSDGQFEKARVIADPSADVRVLLELVHDKKYTFTADDVEALKALAADKTARAKDVASAYFVLAKVHHDRNSYDAAFDFYSRGNTIRDALYDTPMDDLARQFEALQETYDAAFFSHLPAMGNDSESPVFIVGMPRSGTTLVEQIITAHPLAVGGGERTDFYVFAEQLPAMLHSNQPYPACAGEMQDEHAQRLAKTYLDWSVRLSETASRATDKMPGNFLHLGLIAQVFPKARIIHCRRDPMATCFSIYQQNFVGYHPYAYDLEKLGRYYRWYEKLMEHWHKVLPLDILDVDYEDVVSNQEQTSRKILEFCGLDWDARVLEFYTSERNVQTASLWQVRQPIYKGSLEGWRAYEAFLTPLQDALRGA